jgi:hypothetical protein
MVNKAQMAARKRAVAANFAHSGAQLNSREAGRL